MGRCGGCADFCGCVTVAGQGIAVTGSGTLSDPWVVAVSGGINSCDDVLNCMAGHIGTGLLYNTALQKLGVVFSTAPNNIAGPGPDGGVYVPAPGAPGSLAIATTDSAELDFSGDGTVGNPLRAALTGTRSGNWAVAGSVTLSAGGSLTVGAGGAVNVAGNVVLSNNGSVNVGAGGGVNVAGGDVVLGSATAAPGNMAVRVQGLLTGDVWSNELAISGAAVPGVWIAKKNAVEVSRLSLSADGSLSARVAGGVARPLPYATFAGAAQVSIVAAEGKAALVTYLAGLFTQMPIGQCTAISTAQYMGYLTTPYTTASGYYGVNQIDRAAATVTINMHVWAVQMLSTGIGTGPYAAQTAVPGDEPVMDVRLTCHTPGCPNEGIGIDTLARADEEDPLYICGPCGVPMDDVVITG